MTNFSDYEVVLPEVQAILPEDIKTPRMPIGIYAQEAEDLYQWSLKDKAKLMSAGIPETHFEHLNRIAGGLRYSQSQWAGQQKDREDAEEQWANKSPGAYDLRNSTSHALRYAYRNNTDLLESVRAIDEGTGDADMIQDLSDIAVLGRANPEPLQVINFDMTLLDQCEETSGTMADIRAMANGEKFETKESLRIRNQMYTLLKKYVDDIRDAGKYVFWRDESRLKGYRSHYNRQKYLKNKKSDNDDSTM
ncbi:hypothetical protein [Saccharicrinis sp. GN24d3]|uniref:hypothetical protein n=1 Tax=Saccharicrinis sp. GN24d3 TaxID=3458416 RepID=UPI0040353A90